MKRNLKTLLYTTFTGDVALTALLGAGNHIFHRTPPINPNFPIVTFYIATENRDDHKCDQHCNCGALFQVVVDIWDNQSTTTRVDNIETEIRRILHEQYLTDGTIETFWIYKKNGQTLYETDTKIWHEVCQYDFRVSNV